MRPRRPTGEQPFDTSGVGRQMAVADAVVHHRDTHDAIDRSGRVATDGRGRESKVYDIDSRRIVVDRIHEDRMAEARRAHVLRAQRGGDAAHAEHARVAAGPSLLGRLAAALRGPAPADRTPVSRTSRPAPAA